MRLSGWRVTCCPAGTFSHVFGVNGHVDVVGESVNRMFNRNIRLVLDNGILFLLAAGA